jgi:hypothetical protein
MELEYSNKSNEDLLQMYKDDYSKYKELGDLFYKTQEDILNNRIEIEKILVIIRQRNLNING